MKTKKKNPVDDIFNSFNLDFIKKNSETTIQSDLRNKLTPLYSLVETLNLKNNNPEKWNDQMEVILAELIIQCNEQLPIINKLLAKIEN